MEYVNNHIHTIYSFSPYTPTEAVRKAKEAGLATCGIMDHDSIAGAPEFIAAGINAGIKTTVGMETRINLKGSFLEGRLVNNPDQKGVAYVALHGVPHQNIERLNNAFAPYRTIRNERNEAMSRKIAALVRPFGITFDFQTDVLPHTAYDKGGSVTERTLCWALAVKLIAKFGKGVNGNVNGGGNGKNSNANGGESKKIGGANDKNGGNGNGNGENIISVLEKLGVKPEGKLRGYLEDANNPYYEYDLLGVLKGGLVAKFYVDADKECMGAADFIALGKDVGAITAYAYLGDVGDSVTGDKKKQEFEDSYLGELVAWLKKTGFDAVTYMPSRNTLAQTARIRALCKASGLFEISGEDINSPRQSFICKNLELPQFAHLIPATYALIGHETMATKDISDGMFTDETVGNLPNLEERIARFEKIGRA